MNQCKTSSDNNGCGILLFILFLFWFCGWCNGPKSSSTTVTVIQKEASKETTKDAQQP